MNADAIMIRASGLTRRFGALTAVDRLNLEIAARRDLRPGGPGRRRQDHHLRLLCGLLDPTEGQVEVAGYDVARHPDAVKDRIGYMAQRFGLYGDLTVEENMGFYADLFGVTGADRDQLMARLLRMTRMEPFRAPARRQALRRHEAEAGADVHAAAPSRRCCSWTSRPTASTRSRAATSGRSSINWSRTG